MYVNIKTTITQYSCLLKSIITSKTVLQAKVHKYRIISDAVVCSSL